MVIYGKILIVEDNAIVAADVKSRVEGMGYSVTACVARGSKAIESVEQNPPHLILMDIKLKGEMSGIEAASQIRSRFDIPVIYVTSYTDEATLHKAKLTDPFGYIVKPFEDKELKTTIDITLHKHKSERELRASEQWFKTTLNSIGDGVITTDMDGLVTFLNPVAEALTGWDSSVAIGKGIGEIFHIINESSRQKVVNPVLTVIETGQIVGLANHTLLIAKDGQEFPIKDSGAPIVLDGDPVGVVLVFQDNTKEREAERQIEEREERFRQLFENAPLPYQSLNRDGYFITVNQTWLTVLGYEKDDVIGRFFGDFLHPDWRDHFSENFPKFKSIGEVLGVEFEIRRKSGDFITVQFDGKVGSDQEGNFLQTHCVFRDISKEIELKKQIEKNEIILRQNQKLEAIGTLAGGIAHDFNNILSAVIGFTELSLDNSPQGSEQYDNLIEIMRASNRAKELVKQILTFSSQGQEKVEVINICQVFHDAIKMIRATVPSNIKIYEKYSSKTIRILANESQMNQVIVNLVTNGVHSLQGNGAIELGVDTIDSSSNHSEHDLPSPGKYARIFVKDNGEGIDSTIIDEIFDPYFTTKPPEKGSGLGLSVVHGIIKSHQGTITVESEKGIGTTFCVHLPLTDQDAVTKQTATPRKQACPQNQHILVVDDEPAIVKMYKRSLESHGYSVTSRTSSVDALSDILAKPRHFDLVITDMSMPNMTGLQLAKAIKEVSPQLPLILCTGYSDEISEKDSLTTNTVEAVLMKPVPISLLIDNINTLLAKQNEITL